MSKQLRVAAFNLLLLFSSDFIWAQSKGEPARAVGESAPITEMKELEIRVSDAIQKSLPAIVAIDVPHPGETKSPQVDHVVLTSGSGVIISADGLILSKWHVSHKTRKGQFRSPGDEVEVVLQDGRHLKAKVLGAVPARDLSLLRSGIYELQGEVFRVCFARRGAPRPGGFDTKGNKSVVYEFKRNTNDAAGD